MTPPSLGLSLAFLVAAPFFPGAVLHASGLSSVAITPALRAYQDPSGRARSVSLPVEASRQTMAVETCYAVPLPPSRVLELIRNTNPGTTLPVSQPARTADFRTLEIDANDKSQRLLLVDTPQEALELQLSTAEKQRLASAASPPARAAAWQQLLLERARSFQQKGLVGSPAYDFPGGDFRTHPELVLVLREQPAVVSRFRPLLDAVMTGQSPPGIPPATYSWTTSEIRGDRTYSLTGFFSQPLPGGEIRSVECTYFVSSKYFAGMIFRDLWPAEVDGKPGTLVWRLDYVITPALARSKGIERMAAENILLLEIKKSIQEFQQYCMENG